MDPRLDGHSYTPYRPTAHSAQREVRRDHYQTTFPTSSQRSVLPEQHHHHTHPTTRRTHGHDPIPSLHTHPEAQHTFTDAPPSEPTYEDVPPRTREHTHHHIHEIVQPVIHKEVLQRHVIHTTVPVHELRHGEPRHHALGALPPTSVADFTRQRTLLEREGGVARTFEGAPPAALGRFLDEQWAASTASGSGLGGAGGAEHRLKAGSSRLEARDSMGRAKALPDLPPDHLAHESVASLHPAYRATPPPVGVSRLEDPNRSSSTHEMPASHVDEQPPEAPEKKRRSFFRRLRKRTLHGKE